MFHNGCALLPIKLNIDPFALNDVQKYNFLGNNKNPMLILEASLGVPDKTGIISSRCSLNSPILKDIFTDELYQFIHNYLGTKNFWIRNDPVLVWDSKKHRQSNSDSGFFHLDYATHQLSIICYLEDCDLNSTHTVFIPKTHKKFWYQYEFTNKKTSSFIKMALKLKEKNGLIDLIGKKGECWIMDAGNGLHAGKYADDRIMLHINIACSEYYNSGYPPTNDLYDRFLFNKKNSDCALNRKWMQHI